MRKKLFAVIMSAMMMITFMPAMAFAALAENSATATGWHVSPFTATAATPVDEFTYDGAEHEVTYVADATQIGKINRTISYTGTGTLATGKTWTYAASTTAPKVKDAGTYHITATETYFAETKRYFAKAKIERGLNHTYEAGAEITDSTDIATINAYWEDTLWYNGWKNYVTIVSEVKKATTEAGDSHYLQLKVNQRPVVINAKGATTLLKQKVYDGKGIAFTDADLNVTGEWNAKTSAYDKPNTGLVAGDTLFAETVVTPAEVGVYFLTGFAKDKMNKNYVISSTQASTDTTISNGLFVQITKATPVVKITSGQLVIKKGYKKAVKFSTNLGTAKLTKTSGNAKITLSNGKLKVAKSLKKGTYKVTVKAAVAESNNWNAAKRVKKLTIVVK